MQHFDGAGPQQLRLPAHSHPQQPQLQHQWQQPLPSGHHSAPQARPIQPLKGPLPQGAAPQLPNSSAKAAAAAAAPSRKRSNNDGYRERWTKRLPRKKAETWVSDVCSACEQEGGDILVCMGPCLRGFHARCIGEPPLSQQDRATWFCPECSSGVMKCFVCHKFSAGYDDPFMRKCSLGACGRFYHLKCVMGLPRTNSVSAGRHFRCPQHYCSVCERSGDGVDMVKCLRCPASFHSSCTPAAARRLRHSGKAIVCDACAQQPLQPYVRPPVPNAVKLAVVLEEARQEGMPMPPNKKVKAFRVSPSADQAAANDAAAEAVAAALQRISEAAAMALDNSNQGGNGQMMGQPNGKANGQHNGHMQQNGTGLDLAQVLVQPLANGQHTQNGTRYAPGSAQLGNGNGVGSIGNGVSSDTEASLHSSAANSDNGTGAVIMPNGTGSGGHSEDCVSHSSWGGFANGKVAHSSGLVPGHGNGGATAGGRMPAAYLNGSAAARSAGAAGYDGGAVQAAPLPTRASALPLHSRAAALHQDGPSRTSSGEAQPRSKKPRPQLASTLPAASGPSGAVSGLPAGDAAAMEGTAEQAAGVRDAAAAAGAGAAVKGHGKPRMALLADIMARADAMAGAGGVKAEPVDGAAGMDGVEVTGSEGGSQGGSDGSGAAPSSVGGKALVATLLQQLQLRQQQKEHEEQRQDGEQQQVAAAGSPQAMQQGPAHPQQPATEQGGIQEILATLAKMQQLEQEMAQNKAAAALPKPTSGPSSQDLVQQLLACMTARATPALGTNAAADAGYEAAAAADGNRSPGLLGGQSPNLSPSGTAPNLSPSRLAPSHTGIGDPVAAGAATARSTTPRPTTSLHQLLRAAAASPAPDSGEYAGGHDGNADMDVSMDGGEAPLLMLQPAPPSNLMGQYVLRTSAMKSSSPWPSHRFFQQQEEQQQQQEEGAVEGPSPLELLLQLQEKERQQMEQQQREQEEQRQQEQEQQIREEQQQQQQQVMQAGNTLDLLAAAAAAASAMPVRSLRGLSAPVLERGLRQLTGDQIMAVLEHAGVLPDPEPQDAAVAAQLRADGPASFVLLLQQLQLQQQCA